MTDAELFEGLASAAKARDAEQNDQDPSLEPLLEPLGAEAEDRIVGAVLATLDAPGEPTSVDPSDAKVIPLRRRRWPFIAAGASILAAAAALVLVLGRPSVAPLPRYELSLKGSTQTLRSPADVLRPSTGRVVVDAGGRLVLALRPETRVEGTVAARVFATRDAETRSLVATLDQSPQGGVRLDVDAHGALSDQPGPWTLLIVVGRPEALPETAAAAATATDPDPTADGWQRLALLVEVRR